MASKSKSGKDGKTESGAVTKGEVITVRLSPKLKYALELLSRKQHRTQSAVVTWAIQEMMNNTEYGLIKVNIRGTKFSVDNMLEVLWDVHPADRLVKLATHWSELMTYEEEKLIKAFKEVGSWPKKGDSATEAMQEMWPDMIMDPGNGEFYWCG